MNCLIKLTAVALAVTGCLSASAAVSPEEARQLGDTLTPWGAEKAANKDGSIPAYAGGLTNPPASYDPAKKGVLTDPFADEKPLYSVNAKNMAQYADKLSDGLKAALAAHPDARLDVYPSHRTAAYPKWVVDNTLKNATQCKEVGEKLVNCVGGLPFPMPKTGNELIWDHQLAFMGASFRGRGATVFTGASGSPVVMGVNDYWFDYPYYLSSNNGNNVTDFERIRYDYQEPARVAGEKILLHYKIEDASDNVWQYIPGQRRTRLSPDLSYDTPHPQSGGVAAMDELYGFYGPTDRFDFKIVGKKEMLIPYNNFKLYGAECSLDKFFRKGFPNPDCLRWEQHRVWVVEGTLKNGKRHIFSKRVFYIDEDTYNVGVYDNYDMSGKIYRFDVQIGTPAYNDPELGTSGLATLHFDLQVGAWVMDNYPSPYTPIKGAANISEKLPEREWQPDALAGASIR
ncbi:DUF1329 domain-containing protein [Trinickia violacea]|uniref:DUF1329 domain-containing protein n=1 Tax=Trinickia violacea TaxID=2571746 RepID=A0A4P8IMZ5_9BURK|nr:DUF1329 domain-containing protein [Trinickia violacea]QCP50362.1 DUF1329 domain-containing protein [Trinickia violacea]